LTSNYLFSGEKYEILEFQQVGRPSFQFSAHDPLWLFFVGCRRTAEFGKCLNRRIRDLGDSAGGWSCSATTTAAHA
jgi:hypothetical protein